MEGKVLEVLENIKKYGVRYNGAVNVGEIIDLIKGQQAEIERLTKLAELRKIDNDDTCKLLFEAKKQVDELMSRKIEPNIVHCHGFLKGCDMVKQAVKDTAKEIFTYLKDSGVIKVAPDTIKMFFEERYGVEVE